MDEGSGTEPIKDVIKEQRNRNDQPSGIGIESQAE